MSRQDSAPPPTTPFSRECVAFFAEAVQVFGVPKSVGQIYGLLFASPEPLSFSDIAGCLAISKGSASQGLQLLRSLGAIKVVDAPLWILRATAMAKSGRTDPEAHARRFAPASGSDWGAPRRGYYEPELGLRRLIGGVLRERVVPLAAAGKERIRRLRELAAMDEGGFSSERVHQLETWQRRLRTVLPALGTLLDSRGEK